MHYFTLHRIIACTRRMTSPRDTGNVKHERTGVVPHTQEPDGKISFARLQKQAMHTRAIRKHTKDQLLRGQEGFLKLATLFLRARNT